MSYLGMKKLKNKVDHLYRDLSEEQRSRFRQFARENYTAHTTIDQSWHPITLDECSIMNAESTIIKAMNKDKFQ
tara:strand:+ start:4179 stop:4400 length:222 start_codon:yes stop_codon:yes gene_type:complete